MGMAGRFTGPGSWEGVDRAGLEDAIRRTLENGVGGGIGGSAASGGSPMTSPPTFGTSPDEHARGQLHGHGHGLRRHGHALKGLPGNMSPPVRAGV